jgi:hypothetical protein
VNKEFPSALLTPISRREFNVGDYLHSGKDLFRIEEIAGDRVVLEDCLSELLIETDRRQLLALEPVVRSRDEPGDRTGSGAERQAEA